MCMLKCWTNEPCTTSNSDESACSQDKGLFSHLDAKSTHDDACLQAETSILFTYPHERMHGT